jgi:uncharacterized membrane protein
MAKSLHSLRSGKVLTRLVTGVGLVGACTVVDKGDYTFTDDPRPTGGEAGDATGGRGGSSGSTSGSAGEGGDDTGGTTGSGGTATGGAGGTSAGDGGGGTGGEDEPCDPNPCKNDGDCTASGTTFTCDCAPGYRGDTCGEDIDECDPNPCKNMEACENLVADFRCTCSSQMTGKICDIPRFQPIVLGPASMARAVSADGTVVLGSTSAAINGVELERPFIWTVESGPRPLPVPSQARDANVTPFALSGNGQGWVGQFRMPSASSGTPPFPCGGTESMTGMFGLPMSAIAGAAFDTNADGMISVGYATHPAPVGLRGVRWDGTGMPTLLPPPSGLTGQYTAGAVTRDGRIIAGTAKDTAGTPFVVFWAPDGVDTLPTLRSPIATSEIEVHGASADGMTVAGTLWDPMYANFAFMSTAEDGGNIRVFTPMTGGPAVLSNIWDVNDDGQVLVGDADPSMMGMMNNTFQATVWKPDGSAQPLMALLVNARIDPLGWQLSRAYGVSADGKVIVGEGRDPNNQRGGFIVRLP